jgi:hypothetical protein
VSAGVAAKGSTLFLGSNAKLPTKDSGVTFLTLIETGGSAPSRIQNQNGAATQRPTAQISARGELYPLARALAKAAYLALDGVFNTALSGTFYLSITARQEPTDIGLDDVGRPMVVFNIECEKAPS